MVNSIIEQSWMVLGSVSALHVFVPNWVDSLICVGSTAYWVVDSNVLESKRMK